MRLNNNTDGSSGTLFSQLRAFAPLREQYPNPKLFVAYAFFAAYFLFPTSTN
jgi:hypothetical protein